MISPDSPVDWTPEGQPRSRLFGDVYFSAEDGLAESRAVFLAGCGLPEAWAGRRRFVVGELGFGTGLNIAALLHLWRSQRPAGGQLHVFSVEGYPIGADAAARALSHWPELADVAALLTARWPGRAAGVHRVELPELHAILDVAVGDVADALSGWTGRADAWFLDGFSPALNPQMWTDAVLGLVAARSAPGARAATFTVAGAVRRGLAAAGFAVEKRPGHGRKRERLEARLPGAAHEPARPRVAVIGAGIAGAAAARALAALGVEAALLEAAHPGAGASGNPAGLVTPRLDAGLGPPARLFAQAFRRASDLYEPIPAAVLDRGVLQLALTARDAARFAKIAAADLFEPGDLVMLTEAETTARLAEPAPPALDQRRAQVVAPAAILAAWAAGATPGAVDRLEAADDGWRLLGAAGDELARADAVIVAAGLPSARLLSGLPLQPVRGQASWAAGPAPVAPAAWGGYVLPLPGGGVLFGATHDRDDADDALRAEDHARNLALVQRALPQLAARLDGMPLDGRAAVRAVTPDRLPVAGPVGPPGVFALTGFGSRGFAFAPLLAEHVAALALGAPSPLARSSAVLIEPDRFARGTAPPIL